MDNADFKDRRLTGGRGFSSGIELYKGATFIQKRARKLGTAKDLLFRSGENDILFIGP